MMVIETRPRRCAAAWLKSAALMKARLLATRRSGILRQSDAGFGLGVKVRPDHRALSIRAPLPPRLAAQKHDALWLNVNAFIHSCVFLLPTSLIHEKPPQLFMGLHPKHRIDLVFLKHRVPGGLTNLQFDQFEIVAQ